MLPFAQERVDGRKLLIYNESFGSQHPLNAVELTNSSGKTLDGGAVTVFDAGAYAGEALFETIKDRDKRLISYAVDLGARITTSFDSSSRLLSEFTLRRGVLEMRRAVKEVRAYTIHNVDQKPKTVIIERPARPEYKPVQPQPSEKTADTLRYEVPVAAGATEKFAVTEERLLSETIALTNLTYDQLMVYIHNKELDAAGRAKLEQVANLKRQIADADRQIGRLEEQIKELFEDQERLRRNISSLRSVSGQERQVQEFAQKLATQEGELVRLRDQQAELRKQRDELQRQLNDVIENLRI
jgi:DNA repair exonuclease SbcCD ATPase subunit